MAKYAPNILIFITKLPQPSPSSYSIKFYKKLNSSLGDHAFIDRHRSKPVDFTRNTTFTFPRVVGILLATLQHSLQVELDQFFSCIPLPAGRHANDDAFRMARKKLKPSAFVELNQMLLQHAPQPRHRWCGWRVIAADSTTLYLPTTHRQTIAPEEFNHYHDTAGGIYSLARAAALLDVATGLFLRADLASDAVGEREILLSQLSSLRSDDLLVLDRGYPAQWLFALLLQHKQAFCIRLRTSYSPQVIQFVRSGQDSTVITIQPDASHQRRFLQHGLSQDAFQIRLVRAVLPSGQIEVLATSLLDESTYPAAEFAGLYRRRWRIEEAFRHIKCRLKLEQFGGETPLAIRQEFHATILLHNLATLAGLDALSILPDTEVDEAHINLTHASHLLRRLLPLLLHSPGKDSSLCDRIIASILRNLTRKRPDRTAPPRKPGRAKPRHRRAYK